MTEHAKRPGFQARWKELLAEYGGIALVVYLVIFAVVFVGAAVLIHLGFELEESSGGTLVAAWVATKVTQPIRIACTLAITPVVASLANRLKGDRASQAPRPPSADSPP